MSAGQRAPMSAGQSGPVSSPATAQEGRAAGAPHQARVVVADDEESVRYYVARALQRCGYDTTAVEDGAQAIAEFESRRADVVVVDLKMPGADGIEVLSALRRRDPEVIVILMTAFGTISSAVEAMRRGAHDYITKPFDSDELVLLVERSLANRAMARENRDLRRMLDHRSSYAGLIGQSPAIRAVFQTIELVQESDATVLITGESGTGKELVARAVHAGSPRRRGGPLVAIHCAALKDSLVDSELFGYVPGAFTGAKSHREGLIARAAGGTLFLDEVAELSLTVQAKLERFLQEREILPLGAAAPQKVDVRVVAATNRDLEQAERSGAFRRELYFRLNVVPIHLPPLRERREDVAPLVAHFVERFAKASSSRVRGFSVDAMAALTSYTWPGNIRELQNTVERLVVMNAEREILDVDDLPEQVRAGPVGPPAGAPSAATPLTYQEAVAAAERRYFLELFRRTQGNVSEVARLAGLSRGHVHRKASQLGLDPASFRP